MSNENDGGPAFPASPMEWDRGGYGEPACYRPADNTSVGMSLRDYFAAKAMQGILAGDHPITHDADPLPTVARVAYNMADAMLEARKK